MSFYGLLLLGFIAGSANLCGGFLLFGAKFFPRREKSLKYLIALGIGFMLAVIFIEILPKTLVQWQELKIADEMCNGALDKSSVLKHAHEIFGIPMTLFLGGYLLIYTFEQTVVPHLHFNEDSHGSPKIFAPSVVYAAVGGLLVHTFFDGVSLAAAAINDFHAGLLVFFRYFPA